MNCECFTDTPIPHLVLAIALDIDTRSVYLIKLLADIPVQKFTFVIPKSQGS